MSSRGQEKAKTAKSCGVCANFVSRCVRVSFEGVRFWRAGGEVVGVMRLG